jgi:hypothetical protein
LVMAARRDRSPAWHHFQCARDAKRKQREKFLVRVHRNTRHRTVRPSLAGAVQQKSADYCTATKELLEAL